MRPLPCLLLLAACAVPAPSAPPPPAWASRVARDLEVATHAIDVGTRTADFPAMGMRVAFDRDGARAQGADGGLELVLTGWGRADAMRPLPAVEPEAGEAVPGLRLPDGAPTRRLEYARPGLVEWFAGTPEGLEHGWTASERPDGEGPLWFVLETDSAVLDAWDDGVELLDAGGGVWRYDGLWAWDAEGDPLPARFRVHDGALLVEVDDTDATWPIEVDPVLTTAATTLGGPSSASYFGYALASAGDVNADGYDDVIVGAYRANTLAGRAYVYHGSASGLASTATTTLSGGSGYYTCGGSVAGGGDVDGDGYDDVAMACIYASGVVKVFHGSAAGVSSTATTTLSTGGSVRFGYGLAVVPSVDGDAYDDVVVGAPGYAAFRGRLFVYPGSAAGVSSTAATTLEGVVASSFGDAVAAGGDVNGDGYGDVLVGAPTYSASAGRAYVYYGSATGLSSGSVTEVAGSPLLQVGIAVAGGEDVDDDGYDDVFIGTSETSGGRVYVHPGSATGIASSASTTLGESTASLYGTALALGDVDGDGYADLAVGAYGSTEVYLYAGSASGIGSTADTTLSDPGGQFGYSVATADVDGDGYADLVVGDPDDASGFGAAYVYAGYGAAGTTCAADGDDDGYADLGGATVSSADGDCDDPGEADSGDPATDCDDADAGVYPGAAEVVADGIDNDCDGAETCLVDGDGDGETDGSGATVASADGDCADSGEADSSAPTTDCDDADPARYGGATDLPGDAVDQDCDGTWACHADADADGFGGAATVASPDASCADAGEAASATDCDDADPAVSPAATEACGGGDEDCDGAVDEAGATGGTPFYADADGDGYGDAAVTVDACTAPAGHVADATDCDDADAGTHPGADESCGDGDLNCSGTVDDADPEIKDTLPWYGDADGDGYGDGTSAVWACAQPSGTIATGGDCLDSDASAHPGATETVGDGVDQDCDGAELCWVDADGDGARGAATTASADLGCTDAGEAGAAAAEDCDDADAAVSPSATETVADGVDQDCDGGELCYADADGDGVAGADTVASADLDCTAAGEATAAGDDCDDLDAAIRPGVVEQTGDEVDQDCDGTEFCYEDQDDDGYRPDSFSEVPSADTDCGDAGEALAGEPDGDCDDADPAYNPGAAEPDCTDPNDYNCDGSTGYDDSDGDGWAACLECNDADATVNPDATERAGDEVDQDCDDQETCYVDADGDGHRPDGTSTVASADTRCADPGEAGADAPTDDCDDADATVLPGAAELPGDGVDQDCDGAELCWADADDDGWRGDDGATRASADLDCDDAGEADGAAGTGDCDEASAAFHPGATEADCGDPTDYNCDGSTGMDDADGDGYGACEECDDGAPDVYPDAPERCNGRDDDCSGAVDDDAEDATLYWVDADGDGYGDPRTARRACDPPAGSADNDDDCDDADAGAHPGAADVPDDGVDQDCDGADATGADPGDTGDTGDGLQAARTGGLFGGCTSAGSGAGALGVAVAAALATRRRRRA